VTEKVAEHIISLPMYPEIEGEEIKMICDIIAEEISKL
jgi:dTDP-4-amino-4,6-dideoxygalactose transaminase